jgi:hypothetical protein
MSKIFTNSTVFCFVLFCFWRGSSTLVWTRGFILARQVLCHTSKPFLLWLFLRQGLTFCPGRPRAWSSYLCFPKQAGMTGAWHAARLDGVSFLARTGLELRSSLSQPPTVLGWQVRTSVLHFNSTFNSAVLFFNLIQNQDYAFCLTILFWIKREEEKKKEYDQLQFLKSLEISWRASRTVSRETWGLAILVTEYRDTEWILGSLTRKVLAYEKGKSRLIWIQEGNHVVSKN